jgi:pyruvate formate lyase activating enzyme
MGLVDGPGIRFVPFFQGCTLRCAYCHNPDSWSLSGGVLMDVDALFEKTLRYRAYFTASGGGVTCSGGEPLLQRDFLLQYFKKCKAAGIHTALDTAGYGVGGYDELLAYTDLVILDLKHHSDEGYRKLTGSTIDGMLSFKQALDRAGSKLWLRHVVVPGINDSPDEILRMKHLAGQFHNVERKELLPYHSLGVHKYSMLGYHYRLSGVAPLAKASLQHLTALFTGSDEETHAL